MLGNIDADSSYFEHGGIVSLQSPLGTVEGLGLGNTTFHLPLSSLSQRHLPGQGPWGLPSQRRAFLDEKQAGKRVDVEHAGLHAPPVRIL